MFSYYVKHDSLLCPYLALYAIAGWWASYREVQLVATNYVHSPLASCDKYGSSVYTG